MPTEKQDPEAERRIDLERQARQRLQALLDAVVGTWPGPVFHVPADGPPIPLNEAAAAALRCDGGAAAAIRIVIARPEGAGRRVVPITIDGRPDGHLVALEDQATEARRRLERARTAWQLTARQTDVLALTVQGLSNKEVAHRLGCSDNTIEAHLSVIFQKAGCDGRALLIARYWTAL